MSLLRQLRYVALAAMSWLAVAMLAWQVRRRM
jgi:hypothetical protein